MPNNSSESWDDVRFSKCMNWAIEAGEGLLKPKKQEAIFKNDGSPATPADYEIRDLFRAKLKAQFPQDVLSTEEDEGGGSLQGEYLWLLDPIDGTLNFLLGLPFYSVSVGIFREGEPVFGVVYDPVHGHLFVARRGKGAWLNGQPLMIKRADSLPRPVVALRLSFEKSIPSYAQKLLTSSYKFRWLGSTSLQICHCAQGIISALVDHKATIWDIAGASLVLLEAGGIFTDFEGKNIFPLDRTKVPKTPFSVAASVPSLHEAIITETRGSLTLKKVDNVDNIVVCSQGGEEV